MSNFFYVGFRYQVLHFLFNYCLLSLQINTMYPLCSNNVQLHYSGFSAWSRMISPYLDSPPILASPPAFPSISLSIFLSSHLLKSTTRPWRICCFWRREKESVPHCKNLRKEHLRVKGGKVDGIFYFVKEDHPQTLKHNQQSGFWCKTNLCWFLNKST